MAKHLITDDTAKGVCAQLGLVFETRVGEGSFKQVFKVKDAAGQPFALKLTDPAVYSDRSEREIAVLSACTHPSIARLFGNGMVTGSTGGTIHYSIEEFLSGGTLSSKLLISRFSAAQGRRLGISLVEALAYLDSLQRRCVHRDIKPDNVMFREPGDVPVLVDFGIARILAEVSLTQSWLPSGPGTPYYASPEQLNNQKVLIDWRSDQFSLGITLSVACFGVHPFQEAGEPFGAIGAVQRVARRDACARQFVDLCGNNGLDVLVRMVQPWPNHRFRFHADLLGALQ